MYMYNIIIMHANTSKWFSLEILDSTLYMYMSLFNIIFYTPCTDFFFFLKCRRVENTL